MNNNENAITRNGQTITYTSASFIADLEQTSEYKNKAGMVIGTSGFHIDGQIVIASNIGIARAMLRDYDERGKSETASDVEDWTTERINEMCDEMENGHNTLCMFKMMTTEELHHFLALYDNMHSVTVRAMGAVGHVRDARAILMADLETAEKRSQIINNIINNRREDKPQITLYPF